MKKLSKFIIAVALAVATTFPGAATQNFTALSVVNAATVKLNKTELMLTKGETFNLSIKGTKSKVTWKSNKPAIVSVTSKGKVTAKKQGIAKVTATVNKKKYTCNVSVLAKAKEEATNINDVVSISDITIKDDVISFILKNSSDKDVVVQSTMAVSIADSIIPSPATLIALNDDSTEVIEPGSQTIKANSYNIVFFQYKFSNYTDLATKNYEAMFSLNYDSKKYTCLITNGVLSNIIEN